jgi:hypothetical protein
LEISANNVIARYRILNTDDSPSTFIDLDGDGQCAMDDLYTDEPILDMGPDELKDLAKKKELRFLTRDNYGEMTTSQLEREAEDSDDWQGLEMDTLTEVATQLARPKHDGPVKWAIDPMVDGSEEEMAFIILEDSGSPNLKKQDHISKNSDIKPKAMSYEEILAERSARQYRELAAMNAKVKAPFSR